MSDLDLTEDEVRAERMAQVKPLAEMAYLAAVIGLGGVAMLLLISWLGA